MRFRSILAKVSFAGFVVALIVALIASFGTRLGFWDFRLGFTMLIPAVAAGMVGLLAGIVWGANAFFHNSGAGTRWGVIGLVGSLVAVAIPLNGARLAATSPPIHDISTDIEYAPQFKALLPLREGAPNGPGYDGPKMLVYNGKKTTVAALQKKYYEDVIPYAILGITPFKLLKRALTAANDMGWHIVDVDWKGDRIEATDTTFWFGFTDDIVIRVKPAGRIGARLDIRSKSRVGQSDLGTNARRIRAFIKRMKSM
jgi:hypothetical protein